MKLRMKNLAFILVAVLLTVGCTDDSGNQGGYQELHFIFEKESYNWTPGFSDYLMADEVNYKLDSVHTNLPAPLDTIKKSWKLSGNNVNGDLFMYIKRKITGLQPNKEYVIGYNISFASNVATDAEGTASSPGTGVYIKAGVSKIEPNKVLQDDGNYKMNIAKGNQSEAGEDVQVLGNFSNGTEKNEYAHKVLKSTTSFKVTSNEKGELWFMVGVDSGYEGVTTIYIDRVSFFVYWDL